MQDIVEIGAGASFGGVGTATKGLSRWGYAGLALFFVHLALLFFPPLPPDVKGSLWDWLTGYTALALLLVELKRWRSWLVAVWSGLARAGHWARGLAAVFLALLVAVSLRALVPPLYVRFSAEAGFWEPLTLFCYLGSAVLIAGLGGSRLGAERKHWRLVAGAYVILGLEEVDYFGIFGGIIGRIDGIYVGSLHDLIQLAVEGTLSAGSWMVIGLVTIGLAAALWRLGYIQPRALAGLVFSAEFMWIAVGLGFLLAGAVVETGIFEWASREPTLEEALEMAGGICFFLFALGLAATRGRPHDPVSFPTT